MKSMTGMGKSQGMVQGLSLRIEIKSVNHRYLEMSVRLPSRLGLLEIPIRSHLRAKLARGKIDLFITEEKSATVAAGDMTSFQKYHEYLKNVAAGLGIKSDIPLELVIAGAGSFNSNTFDIDAAWNDFKGLLDQALSDLDRMRVREGGELKKDISLRIITISEIKTIVSEILAETQQDQEQKIRKKILERQDELLDLDPARLHIEVLYYLDRLDLSEEIARLDSHLGQLSEFLEEKKGEALGRKLDFIIQEINREFNTIGSKCQNAEISQKVILAKAELEKIREQVQNIE